MKLQTLIASSLVVGSLAALGAAGGCKSQHQPGVTSNILKQWTDVSAEPTATTAAARAVFEEDALKNITANNTNRDGVVTGMMADGTTVTATIKKNDAGGSQVTVAVGNMGSPTVGADLAARIKARAETR